MTLEDALRRGPSSSFAGVSAPPTFAEPDIAYAVHDTPIGRLLLARRATGDVVASRFAPTVAAEDATLVALADRVSPRVVRQPRALDEVRSQLDDYLAGTRRDLGLRIDLGLASAFGREVLTALQGRVGYSERAAYADVASWVGRPKAARAVGAALGANPVCVFVPCHRIVSASGALTGYAGGLAAKEYLLALEATSDPRVRSHLAPSRVRYL